MATRHLQGFPRGGCFGVLYDARRDTTGPYLNGHLPQCAKLRVPVWVLIGWGSTLKHIPRLCTLLGGPCTSIPGRRDTIDTCTDTLSGTASPCSTWPDADGQPQRPAVQPKMPQAAGSTPYGMWCVKQAAGRFGMGGQGARAPHARGTGHASRQLQPIYYARCHMRAHAQAGLARWRPFCAIGRVYSCADAGRFIWPSNSHSLPCAVLLLRRIRAAGVGLRANCASMLGGQGGVEGARPNAANWVRWGCPKRHLRLGHTGMCSTSPKMCIGNGP